MKDFNRQKVILFLIAAALGFLFKTLNVPIPYMLGGIVVTFVAKTFVDPKTNWPAAWRNFMLSVGGCEIGRDCSFETLVNLSNQVFGVLSATGSIVVVSLIASWLTYRMSSVNLISCFMGCAPGGMTLMTLMAEEDSRSDMNFVVVAQTLRFTCVVVSVPFLAMNMLDENATAVAIQHGDELPWLMLVPLVFLGRFVGKKFHLPTKQLLGPILVAAVFSTAVQPFEAAPKLLMAVVQLNIGLYIGTKLEKERLLKLRSTLPNLFFGNAAMIATSVAMAVFLSQTYGFSLITAFLAMAPGGIAEMCLAGLSMGADVPQILTYQLFRLLFLNFTLPFAINWYFKKPDEPQTTN